MATNRLAFKLTAGVTVTPEGASASVIVPCPELSMIVPFVAFDRLTVKDLVGSGVVSPMIGTEIVNRVTPGANVSVLDVAMKSVPLMAVPAKVE